MEGAVKYPELFDTTVDATASQRWTNYVKRLERYFVMMTIAEPERKQSTLLYYGGEDLSSLYGTLEDKLVLEDANNGNAAIDIWTATKTVFKTYFCQSDSVTSERSKFRGIAQRVGESVTDYVTRLKKGAKYCKFNEYSENAAIIDQFIENCASDTLRVKLLATSDLTLDLLLSTAKSREMALHQAKEMGNKPGTSSASSETVMDHELNYAGKQKSSQYRSNSTSKQCFGCGSKFHFHGSDQCKAKNKKCHNCGIANHFADMCRSGKQRDNPRGSRSTQRGINQIDFGAEEQVSETNQCTNDSLDSFTFLTTHGAIYNAQHSSHKRRTIMVDDKQVSFIIDSGATSSIIDLDTFNKHFKNSTYLEPANVNIYIYIWVKRTYSLSWSFLPNLSISVK